MVEQGWFAGGWVGAGWGVGGGVAVGGGAGVVGVVGWQQAAFAGAGLLNGVGRKDVGMVDIADAYVEVQDRLVTVVAALDANAGETPVPACPGWSVRDLMAHLAGGVVDVTTGRELELTAEHNLLDQWRDADVAAARDALTARQVAERKGRTMAAIVEEWRGATEALLPMMRGEQPYPVEVPPFISGVLVNDVVVHEGDIRAALGLGRAPVTAALSIALRGYAFSLENRIRVLGLPALVFEYDDGKQLRLGDGESGATVRADRHELVRMMAGRRTTEQVLGPDWSGDPEPFLPILPEYGPVTAPTDD